MIDINSIESYKVCRKKKVDYWLCIPPKGTVVIQKFEQYSLLQQLKPYIRGISDSCFIQAKDFLALKQSNAQLYNFILQNCDIVGKSGTNIVVICGTEGEMWTTTYDYACKHYQAFSYNTVISLAQAVNERAKKYGNDTVVPWMRVTSSNSNQCFACFVPVKEKGSLMTAQGQINNYNQLGVAHGKGDFILCESVGGKPNIANRWVVNGLVFSNTYDNRGWQDYITVSPMNIAEPVNLWTDDLDNEDNSVDSLITWYNERHLTNFVDFLTKYKNKLSKKILSALKTAKNVVSYLETKERGVVDSDNYAEPIELDELCIATICVKLPNNIIILVSGFNYDLCGWNYSNENGQYSDDPYEVEYATLNDVKSFVAELKNSSSTYDILLKASKDNGVDEITKCITDLTKKEILAINTVTFSSKYLNAFIANITKSFKKYGMPNTFSVNADSMTYDNSDYIQFMYTIKGKSNEDIILTYEFSTASCLYAFAYINDDEDCIDDDLVIEKYDSYVSFIKRVLTGENIDSEKYRVAEDSSSMLKLYRADNGAVLKTRKETLYSDINYDELTSFLDNWFLNTDITRYAVTPFTLYNEKDYIQVKQDLFIDKLFKLMDKIQNKVTYSLTEQPSITSTSSLGVLVILGRSNVGRIYCRLDYIFGSFYIHISKSTLSIIEYENPSVIQYNLGSKPTGVVFEPMHYYQVMLRLGLFPFAFNIKNLKLAYMKYNHEVFNDILNKKVICITGNYKNDVNFNKADDYSAYYTKRNGYEYILFNGVYNNVQSTLSLRAKATMLHEMCHFWTVAVYGTVVENDGEDGKSIYNISEKYKDQWCYHGKHFGEGVQLVADKTGISFNDIFGYGLGKHTILWDKNDVSSYKTLAVKNVYNFGQEYRKFSLPMLESCTFCQQHGEINCRCTTGKKLEIPAGRYIGVCRNCGKSFIYSDYDIDSISPLNVDYLDVVDRLGVVSCSKCDSCGGSIKPLIAKDESNRELFKDYLKDLNFAKRYVHHMYDICIRNMSKYERYFNTNYNCSISLEEGVIPYLGIEITNGASFSEDFKFFVSCSVNHKPIGSLYRDYGFDAKGVKLHTFRINTDKNILDFFDYVMNYVRKSIRES